MQYSNFTRGRSGNIFTFVKDDLNCSFPDALKKIAKWIGVKDTGERIKQKRKPFGGFYEYMIVNKKHPEASLKTISESELPSPNNLPVWWVEFNVSLQTMEEWGVRLDLATNRIVIPWYNYNGEICGAKYRVNDNNCPMDKRWGMFIAFPKSLCVYGWFKNYPYIVEKRTVVIVEAEKSVLQAWEFGSRIFLAIGGHNFSETQVKYIKALHAERIIVAFDEGVCEEEIQYEAKKLLINNHIYKNQVEYIYDGDHTYLKEGSKDSPTDNGLEIWKNLFKKCRYRLNG